jgi:crotonobetainyl-CoA:carnitine CoA-transferase CaiB-like acyl-CoA transferase
MRNKRSLGLNLRSDEGKKIFADLVKVSDVVLTNFKPGTLASLGFDMDTLLLLNPQVILSESSAFGNHGTWSRRLGYGPLVRASAGLSSLWSYPEDQDGFSDAITIFPDHVVARLNAAAIVALLIRRDRTGAGGRVSTAQVDAIFGGLADALLAESLAPGSGNLRTTGNDRSHDAFRGVYAAKGDDEWIVIDADNNERFRAAATAIGRPDLAMDPAFATPAQRWARRHELRTVLADWTRAKDARSAAAFLQAAGVPAGAMFRAEDLQNDPHLRRRNVFGKFHQPQLEDPFITNLGEARGQALPGPRLMPAPLMAEHTREVLIDTLGLKDAEIDRLLELGAVEENPAARRLSMARTP